MGIVIELQKEAIDESVSIETLVRKAFLVARKLELQDFEKWLRQEQNGYKEQIPEYRNIAGEIKAWNPYHGWLSIIKPADIDEIISKMPIAISISALQDVYESSEAIIRLAVNGKITEWLNENTDGFTTTYSFFASKSEIYRIISTVRNKILDWAILLEENGIVGDGMSFTETEKYTAQNTYIINNYTNNFYEVVTDIDIDQG